MFAGRTPLISISHRVSLDISLPQICVLGSQSVGKSSLIESISGVCSSQQVYPCASHVNVVRFPSPEHRVLAQGMMRSSVTFAQITLKGCTRCPTECILIQSSEPWECEVSLKFQVDARNVPLARVRNFPFGPTIRDPAQVEDRLRRAQLAILNADLDRDGFPGSFLTGNTPEARSVSFSQNCISLKVRGPDIVDLSFVDLPGKMNGSSVFFCSSWLIHLIRHHRFGWTRRPEVRC